MEEPTNRHWTHEIGGYVAFLALNAEDQVIELAEARNAGGAITDNIAEDIQNPQLLTMVQHARDNGLEMSVVVHTSDGIPDNFGPVTGEMFVKCWEAMGRPYDQPSLDEALKKLKGITIEEFCEALKSPDLQRRNIPA